MKAAHQWPRGPRRFSPNKKEPQETRFQKEGEHSLHRQRLSDHSAGSAGELSPVGAELKFHGNSRHHSHREIDAEDVRPEARRVIILFVTGPQRQRFQNHNEQRQPHRELRKQIVESNSVSKVQAING